MNAGQQVLVRKRDLRDVRINAHCPAATGALAPGQARLRIEHFALTANNITYAVTGDSLKYWQFFPTGDDAWGCVPVWGFATVAESQCEGVAVGERFYGYLPMASHLIVEPVRVKAGGFIDNAAHRRELPPLYNQLQRCAGDPGYDAAHEAEQALLRPLFVTSFLIDDFFGEANFFGAEQLVLSSASSKTAYGTAFCLAQRSPKPVRVIGLTSARNIEFTRSLGCYDEVLTYEDIAKLPATTPAAYVDFSGDVTLRRAVHEHFQDALKFSSAIGATHWEDFGGKTGPLPGAKPIFFFAPSQAQKRSGPPPEGWGRDGFMQRLGAAWGAFMQPVTAANPPWMDIVSEQGAQAMQRRYLELLEGRGDPREGLMLAF
jgi:Protein of unknown function (DUF2855)